MYQNLQEFAIGKSFITTAQDESSSQSVCQIHILVMYWLHPETNNNNLENRQQKAMGECIARKWLGKALVWEPVPSYAVVSPWVEEV